jgi:putative DNA primase/helicase
LREYIYKNYYFCPASAPVQETVMKVAEERSFHPLRDYLLNLKWDGTARVASFFHTYFGCEDNEYSRLVSTRWLVACVGRPITPGLKVDNMPIFEGDAGLKKSTAVQKLCPDPDYFCDDMGDLNSKDTLQQMSGKFIVEFGELASLLKSERELLYRFITTTVDNFRPPYGRATRKYPRQCVFVGTTNHPDYLTGDEAERRFWPVSCTKADAEGIEANRDQILAEAVHLYQAGERWWLTPEEALICASVRPARIVEDTWESILSYHVGHTLQRSNNPNDEFFVLADLLSNVLQIPLKDQSKQHQMRAVRTLKKLGLARRQKSISKGEVRWVYVPSADVVATALAADPKHYLSSLAEQTPAELANSLNMRKAMMS